MLRMNSFMMILFDHNILKLNQFMHYHESFKKFDENNNNMIYSWHNIQNALLLSVFNTFAIFVTLMISVEIDIKTYFDKYIYI